MKEMVITMVFFSSPSSLNRLSCGREIIPVRPFPSGRKWFYVKSAICLSWFICVTQRRSWYNQGVQSPFCGRTARKLRALASFSHGRGVPKWLISKLSNFLPLLGLFASSLVAVTKRNCVPDPPPTYLGGLSARNSVRNFASSICVPVRDPDLENAGEKIAPGKFAKLKNGLSAL